VVEFQIIINIVLIFFVIIQSFLFFLEMRNRQQPWIILKDVKLRDKIIITVENTGNIPARNISFSGFNKKENSKFLHKNSQIDIAPKQNFDFFIDHQQQEVDTYRSEEYIFQLAYTGVNSIAYTLEAQGTVTMSGNTTKQHLLKQMKFFKGLKYVLNMTK